MMFAVTGLQLKSLQISPKSLKLMIFSAAVNFELLENSISEVEQFAKDYVDCEEKEYRRMIDEFNEY